MNQRSKIGPTSEEKTAWKCNSSEYNNRYVAFTSSQQVVAKPPAVILSDNADTFRCGEDMAKDSSYMYDYAEKPSSAPIRVKRSKEPSSIRLPSCKISLSAEMGSSLFFSPEVSSADCLSAITGVHSLNSTLSQFNCRTHQHRCLNRSSELKSASTTQCRQG